MITGDLNKSTGLFQVGSINVGGSGNSNTAAVDYTTFGAGAQTQLNGMNLLAPVDAQALHRPTPTGFKVNLQETASRAV